ncbi:hypothetical protein E4U43_005648 [Claviceps pusilla]|uniref:Uncharacterized protein n=1 Tax=Claviceps pusilla TaxID=123648 RepID=A0A9P7N1T8_9HYPO|nr:hypothetical protein E4U43_005648 [Claviceps pusilla]
MSAQSTSYGRNPGVVRRPSISSRLSFAVSTAEQGDTPIPPPGQGQIEEEIAEIKRYESAQLRNRIPSHLIELTPCPIDWVQDASREQARRKTRQQREAGLFERGQNGWRYRLWASYDAAQGWIVVTIIGAAIGLNAAFLNIITEWLSDIKLGYCTTAFYLNEKFCCWGEDNGQFSIPALLLLLLLLLPLLAGAVRIGIAGRDSNR